MNIAVTDLAFTYPGGVQALRGVNLHIAAGEAVAVLGQNGGGKTTLAKHLNGLLRPTGGQVLVGDWDTRSHTVARLAGRVGYVFQNPDDQLFERSVLAEVRFGPRNLGRSESEIAAAAAEALEQVGLAEAAASHPYDLHLSQRKLLALAAVLAMRTPVLVLDEPTTGQDGRGLARIGTIVDQLKATGRTVIAISHDVDFCAEHFERTLLMAGGQILLDGPAREVFAAWDLLWQTAVAPPQIARLAAGLGLPERPLTVSDFVEALSHARRKSHDT
jgi:energy-coupling factor transport system ATP-binding protein